MPVSHQCSVPKGTCFAKLLWASVNICKALLAQDLNQRRPFINLHQKNEKYLVFHKWYLYELNLK